MTVENRINELAQSYWTTPRDSAKVELAAIARYAVKLLREGTTDLTDPLKWVGHKLAVDRFLETGVVENET